MTLSYVEIGLNTTFALFAVIHVAILIAVFWHIFVTWNEIETGRILKNTKNVRPVCLGGASSSGLDFSSISSMQETNNKYIISHVNNMTPVSCL